MEEFSKYIQQNYAWLIASIVAITGVGINLLITKNRSKKAFSYRVLLDQPLVTKRRVPGTKGNIEIRYEGKPVEAIRIINVELRNTGGQPLDASDFVEPIEIHFHDFDELLEYAVVKTFPSEFSPIITACKNVITLQPTLMNQGDWLTVMVLLPTKNPFQIEIKGRVKGVQTITKYEEPIDKVRFQYLTGIFSVMGALTSYILLLYPKIPANIPDPNKPLRKILFGVIFILLSLVIAVGNSYFMHHIGKPLFSLPFTRKKRT